MRSIRLLSHSFAALVLATFLMSGAHANQTLEQQVQASAQWFQQSNAIAAEYLVLIDETLALDDVSYEYLEGTLDHAGALKQAEQINSNLKRQLVRLDAAAEALPPPPAVSEPSLKAQLDIVVNYLVELREQIGALMVLSEDAFQAALNDDDDAFQILFLKQINFYVLMIESENRVIRQRMGVLQNTVPEYHLMAVFYSLNDAMIDLLRLTDRLIIDGTNSTAITNFTTSARIAISESEYAVGRGIDATFTTIREIRSLQPESAEQRDFIARLLQALEVYHDEFAVEEKISVTLSVWADDMSTLDMAEEDTGLSGEQFTDWYTVLEKLINARLELQNKRISIMAGTQ